jgi:hypothetical protein
MAVAYAKRHKDTYSAVLWLNTRDEDSLKQSFVRLANQILQVHPSASQLSSVDMDGNPDVAIAAVKAWLNLSDNKRWLMIYDNYDNPKDPGNSDPSAMDIRKYLPESYQGSLIIMTQSSQVKIGHSIRLGKLENKRDSLRILSNTSGRKGLMNGKDYLDLGVHL